MLAIVCLTLLVFCVFFAADAVDHLVRLHVNNLERDKEEEEAAKEEWTKFLLHPVCKELKVLGQTLGLQTNPNLLSPALTPASHLQTRREEPSKRTAKR